MLLLNIPVEMYYVLITEKNNKCMIVTALVSEKHVCAQGLSLSCRRLSVVFLWRLCRATQGPPFRAPVYRGWPCRDPPVCHRVQDDSGAKGQPFLVWLLVLMESRSRLQLRILTAKRNNTAGQPHKSSKVAAPRSNTA